MRLDDERKNSTCTPQLPSTAKAGAGNEGLIAAVNRCAT